MKNIDEESTSNWGTAVLAYLYRELCTESQREKINIGGAMQLLQIWAWSRIITLAPILSNNVADLMPTIDDPENILPVPPYARRWSYHISRTHTAHNAIRIIRNTLDRMQKNEIDRRGHHGEDWTAFHRHYVLKWNDIHSLSVVRPEVSNGRATVPDYMNWYHQILRVQISHWIVSTNTIGYRPTDPRNWEAVCEGRTNGTYEAGPSNVYTEPGPSNVYTPAGPSNVYTPYGPSNVYTPAGPSNVYTEAGPSNAFTPEQALNISPVARRYFGISPVPFEGSDLNTPVDERQVQHPPRRNRRRPRCGTGDMYSGYNVAMYKLLHRM
ncbi:UNVERIFIED_CONTAM: hypothetical protein Slati_2882900 [Sesamum latifolium]|uniref:Aminotransferase-like plant mobile domain-containing protein n=1 Tax=Sesamum latifolium TaxID=2727402 RepID=A0AAW2VFI4_9LAMI